MRLVERGQLDLDGPVLLYVPGFGFSDPELGARMTLRHLLSHSSGLAAGGKDFGPPDRDALARFVHEQLSRYAFVAEPGSTASKKRY
jgi:CubicO group peptidase (beta-lactamase class C family)